MVNFNLLPLIVVNSPGTPTIYNWPIWKIWCGKTKGTHSIGLIRPTSSKIGLGAWHKICSWVGLDKNVETNRQKIFVEFDPCVKSKSPGPSVVPPANESPSAAWHVVSLRSVDVNRLLTCTV
jgi:hypothetical protein